LIPRDVGVRQSVKLRHLLWLCEGFRGDGREVSIVPKLVYVESNIAPFPTRLIHLANFLGLPQSLLGALVRIDVHQLLCLHITAYELVFKRVELHLDILFLALFFHFSLCLLSLKTCS
jgi:hypothetical protein